MDKSRSVLVLGANGMLGSMVYDYFSQLPGFIVRGTVRPNELQDSYQSDNYFPFDASLPILAQMETICSRFIPDYIINCIGIIKPYCRDTDPKGIVLAIDVNARFPWKLSLAMSTLAPDSRILQIATDCVFSGIQGNYNELSQHDALDVYGKTKSLGEVIHENLLNLRCSIIGPEVFTSVSLLGWFLGRKDGDTVTGYQGHLWNGVTTLQFAEYCYDIIMESQFDVLREKNHVLHYVPNETVSKLELLQIFNSVFQRNIIIQSDTNIQNKIDRTIDSVHLSTEKIPMHEAIASLKAYILKSEFFQQRVKML